jgi:hypothetical protein
MPIQRGITTDNQDIHLWAGQAILHIGNLLARALPVSNQPGVMEQTSQRTGVRTRLMRQAASGCQSPLGTMH